MGNIHAGEVDGKEALLMLARELATAKEKPLLKDLVIVFAPIFNADGNEKISKENRREQDGPGRGVGIRENAAGLDLNRDYIKLDSPEVRASSASSTSGIRPSFIDCHTTNGSHHRYTITYEGPVCPAGDPKLIALVRDELLPEVGRRLEKRSGYKSFFYGNFSARSQTLGDGAGHPALRHALLRFAKPHRHSVGIVQLRSLPRPRAGHARFRPDRSSSMPPKTRTSSARCCATLGKEKDDDRPAAPHDATARPNDRARIRGGTQGRSAGGDDAAARLHGRVSRRGRGDACPFAAPMPTCSAASWTRRSRTCSATASPWKNCARTSSSMWRYTGSTK